MIHIRLPLWNLLYKLGIQAASTFTINSRVELSQDFILKCVNLSIEDAGMIVTNGFDVKVEGKIDMSKSTIGNGRIRNY